MGRGDLEHTDDLYESADYENIVAKLDKKYEAILNQNGLLGQAREVAPAAPSGGRLSADEILNEATGRGF
jgi:hypothetical protein